MRGRCAVLLRRPARRRAYCSVWLPALVMLSACVSGDEPRRHEVEIAEFAYRPDTIVVGTGDTVAWVNRDMVPHTVTAHDGAWDSGTIASAQSWSFVAQQAGESSYVCTLHPSMSGVIVVR